MYLLAGKGTVLSDNIEDYPEGILVAVDKPYRWTSADVIRKVKWAAGRHFHKKNLKVGHAGTLDPLATGVLLVCVGKATKMAEELQKSPKEYLAGITFGAVTASYDLEKEIVPMQERAVVTQESIAMALEGMKGKQMQVAPLFSAKSVDGVRAYEMARKLYRSGESVEGLDILQKNLITMYDLALESFGTLDDYLRPDMVSDSRINVAPTAGFGSLPACEVRVGCSKGTYIRALARDLGEALGTGGFLHSLRRTRNGGIGVEDALGMEDVMELFGK